MRIYLRSALFTGALLVTCAILASPGDAVEPSDLQRCAAIADDAERLACYDTLSTRVSSEPSSDPEQRSDREPEHRQPEEREPQVKYETPSEIVSGIAGTAKTPHGKLILTLDNGQVWKQADFEWLRLEEPETRRAVIKKSRAGAFWLKLEGGSKRIRVVRVR